MYETILFDLDGTLIDSAEGIKNSFRYTFDKFGLPEPTDEYLNVFIGPPLLYSFEGILGFPHEKAVHAVDECVKKVTDKILAMGGSAIVTADHGNADQMLADNGVGAFTQHTTFPVPVILVSEEYKNVTLREDGVLADLAPTLLDMMKLAQPKEMTGKSLIK